MRVSTAHKPAATSRPTEAKRLPPIYLGPTLSKKLDKAIVDPDSKRERQLKFSTKAGFVSPAGNPLQVVYLSPAATKSGLDITYVDAKAKLFWAQAPGVSGLARGPFKLPAGADKDLAKVTARELKVDAKPKRPVRPEVVFQNTGSDNAAIRRALNGSSGSGGGGYAYGGGSGGGGGGGLGWGS